MACSKKDYQGIAEVILYNVVGRDTVRSEWLHACGSVARGIADYFESTNDKFDREIFLAACGIGEASVKEVKTSKRVAKKLKG